MTRKKIGLTAFFVYGTLKPGGLYWPRVADLVAYYEPGQVRGRLYDTGLGYPAAEFGGHHTIDGVLLFVVDPKVAELTAIMDEIEEEAFVAAVACRKGWDFLEGPRPAVEPAGLYVALWRIRRIPSLTGLV